MWSTRRKFVRDAASATRHPFLEEAGSDLQPTHIALQCRRTQPRRRCVFPSARGFDFIRLFTDLLCYFSYSFFAECRCAFAQPRRFVGSTTKALPYKKESGNSGSTLWSPTPHMPVNATNQAPATGKRSFPFIRLLSPHERSLEHPGFN